MVSGGWGEFAGSLLGALGRTLRKVAGRTNVAGREESGKFAGFRMVGTTGHGVANWHLLGARRDLLTR